MNYNNNGIPNGAGHVRNLSAGTNPGLYPQVNLQQSINPNNVNVPVMMMMSPQQAPPPYGVQLLPSVPNIQPVIVTPNNSSTALLDTKEVKEKDKEKEKEEHSDSITHLHIRQKLATLFDNVVKGNSTITNYRGEYTGKLHKESGLFHGRGTLITPAGDKYSGEWLDGELNGHGIYVGGKQDDQYEGEWKNGKMDGIGKFKWANGDTYEGNYNTC